MGRWGPSLLIFILVRKYWQNNYKRRFHTRQASVFHELFVKDDLSRPLLLLWLGELHKGPRWMTRSERRRLQNVENISKHFRISIQMLSNGSDFFDVTLVWSDYKDGGANEIKTSRKRGSSQVIFMLVLKCWQTNYKRRFHTRQASVFHRLLVKDDLSKHALAFTWWAPHGPKLDDKKGEEDNDLSLIHIWRCRRRG